MSSVVIYNGQKFNGVHLITLHDNSTGFYFQALHKDYRDSLGDTPMRETPELEGTHLWGIVKSRQYQDRRNQQIFVDIYSINHQAFKEMVRTTNEEYFLQRTTAPLRGRFS